MSFHSAPAPAETKPRRAPRVPTLERYETFLEGNGFKASTITAKVRIVRMIAAHAGVEPAELEADDVLAYFAARKRERNGLELAANTRRTYRLCVRDWCSWAGLEDITADIRNPPIPEHEARPIAEDDLAILLGYGEQKFRQFACSPRSKRYAWIVFGAFLGLRAHESAKVAVEDVVENDGGVRLRVNGKGGKVKYVDVPPIAERVLRFWVAQTPQGGRFWESATSQSVRWAVDDASKKILGKALPSHSLRYRFGTQFYEASGHDLRATQAALRHSNMATTVRYVKVDGHAVRSGVFALAGAC